MAKYRKKPVEVEAFVWTGDIKSLPPHAPDWEIRGQYLYIRTREGAMRADPGDYIVREPFPTDDRRFYPCKPELFAATYEKVD